MRVKLGKRIYLCTLATCSGDIILLTTNNGIYTVKCYSEATASICHLKLLKDGYFDFSNFDYTN